MKLTDEERAILESVERAERKSVPGLAKERRRYQSADRAALRKDKRVNIRMSE